MEVFNKHRSKKQRLIIKIKRVSFLIIILLQVTSNLLSASGKKVENRLIGINVYAVDWDILFCGGLLAYRIAFADNVVSQEIHDEKILKEIDDKLRQFEQKAKMLNKGLVDVRARFDLFYSDGSIKMICFSEPYYLSINGNIYRDDDGDLNIFGHLLPDRIGNRFFKYKEDDRNKVK